MQRLEHFHAYTNQNLCIVLVEIMTTFTSLNHDYLYFFFWVVVLEPD